MIVQDCACTIMKPCATTSPAMNANPSQTKYSIQIPCPPGQVSDGYHTFDELYDHRCVLFLCLMRCLPECAWFSQFHADGTTMDGWFIAGIKLNTGDVTYHLPMKFFAKAGATGAKPLPRGLEWDGHTSADVLERLKEWLS